MSETSEIARDLGAHDEAIGTLKQEVSGLRTDIAELKTMITGAKGGVRMMLAVAGLAASIAEALHWLRVGSP